MSTRLSQSHQSSALDSRKTTFNSVNINHLLIVQCTYLFLRTGSIFLAPISTGLIDLIGKQLIHGSSQERVGFAREQSLATSPALP
ncbi:hypothetical protein M378DRAFT_352491 [Amanita muscaria Koide BX008]|uniref:Uncharacterized protein n=1 Tax=Amanita muscaria (strain Koide BX008) TaxID=946122 RepID=A0A0C2XBU8_AMAMK|nr:hypothetical protein M378DRAFT_352491 [Amanita muscaria Koide BX008]